MKPFEIEVPYTPRWRGNRKRESDDQFTVRIRDLDTREKNRRLKELREKTKDNGKALADAVDGAAPNIFRDLDANVEFSEWLFSLGKEFLVSVDGLVIEKDGKKVEVKTPADVEEHVPTLLEEIAARILNGADEEELKNSPSPQSA